MGYLSALDMASQDITLEAQIEWHLRVNHYPPVPTSMVEPCIKAIDAYYDDALDQEIDLPDGVSFKGQTTAPARDIIIQHHLEAWLQDEED